MAAWKSFASAQPEMAGRAAAVLGSSINAVLGTVRADGSPRLSGIDPFFASGELWIGSMPGARKGDDLRRDARLALHSIPWESRRLGANVTTANGPHDSKKSSADPEEADVKVAGRGILLEDPDEHAQLMAWFLAERGFEPPEPSDLFRIDLTSVVVISVADDQLMIDSWSTSGGRVTVRHT